jgi:hypothetical protein
MTIDEYAQWVASISKPGQSRYERLSYSALALIGEAWRGVRQHQEPDP